MGDFLESKRAAFVKRAGGHDSATLLIKAALKCSLSKADKLAGGYYPSRVTESERKVLAALFDGEMSAESAS